MPTKRQAAANGRRKAKSKAGRQTTLLQDPSGNIMRVTSPEFVCS